MKRQTVILIAAIILTAIAPILTIRNLYNKATYIRAENARLIQENSEKSQEIQNKLLEIEQLKQNNDELNKQLISKNEENARFASVMQNGSGSCYDEIKKYNWNHDIATRVMIKESSGNPGNLNDNPNTGDYSVGCFQINLLGSNAATRPSEYELKHADVNVAFAYKLYVASGHTFCTQGGWINTCRAIGISG